MGWLSCDSVLVLRVLGDVRVLARRRSAQETHRRRIRSGGLGESSNSTPVHRKARHQLIDAIHSLMLRLLGEVGVANRGQNRLVAEDFLDLDQIDTGFNQMRGIAVA
jgi:hypothetical protein